MHQVLCNCAGLCRRRSLRFSHRRNQRKFLRNLESAHPNQLGNRCGRQARCVELHTHHAYRRFKADLADAVHVPDASQCKGHGFTRWRSIAEKNLNRGHNSMIPMIYRALPYAGYRKQRAILVVREKMLAATSWALTYQSDLINARICGSDQSVAPTYLLRI